MKQYLYKGIVYSVIPCDEKDIPSHIERVYSYWTYDKLLDIDRRYNELHYCVSTGQAYKLVTNNIEYATVYYHKFIKYTVILLFWTRLKPYLAMMLDWGESIHKNDIVFAPHRDDFIQYRFLLSEEAQKSKPFVIDVTSREYIRFMDRQRKKFVRL